MRHGLLLLVCGLFTLPGGMAQQVVQVEVGTTVRIAPGTTVRTADHVLISGAQARLVTEGVLELLSPDTHALVATGGGGVLNESATGQGVVRWNMRDTLVYQLPFVTDTGDPVQVRVRPLAAAAGQRMVGVHTFATSADNTPLPVGVTNTQNAAGQELSPYMADRYWVILSADSFPAGLGLQWAATEDPLPPLTDLRASRWMDTSWEHPATGTQDLPGRWVFTDPIMAGGNDRGPWCVQRWAIPGAPVRLALRVFLEGPFDTLSGLMVDSLRALADFPLQEPYSALGWLSGPSAGASIDTTVLQLSGPDAIVDWVLVEWRPSTDPSTVQEARCALLQRDGDVVDLDGASLLTIAASGGADHVAIRHRNHLGVMTLPSFAWVGDTVHCDLTDGSVAMYGTDALKPIGAVWAMVAGNATPDALLKYLGAANDRDPILLRIGGSAVTGAQQGYYNEDVNLDGWVRYVGAGNDRDPILVNIGGTGPTAVRVQQLP